MRYLPVFLDLQTGPVVLAGSGELALAKLRVLLAAGARIRWYATSGAHDAHGLEPAQLARIDFAKGDPLTSDLSGVVAVFCAGAGDVGDCDGAACEVARPARQCDGRHRAFHFHFSGDRRPRRRRGRDRHRRHLARGGAAPAREDRGDGSGAHRRAREVHRPFPQTRSCPHSRGLAAPPLLGARDRRSDRRAGAVRSQG